MVKQHMIEVGNAIIVLGDDHDPFSDGHTTGYLEFYDEWHRPAFPLTSQVISDHLMTVINDLSMPALWRAGRITGWMEALMENAPDTFRSVPLEEPVVLFPQR